MTATAKRLLAEIKTLPPSDIAEMCDSVPQLATAVRSAARPPREAANEAIHASRGLFVGSGLTEKLLRERQREQAQEQAE
jgi:hypothetical protein